MKVFVDANVIIAVLNKEYPLFTFAARVLSVATQRHYQLVTTSVCLAIAFYFTEKKHGSKKAKEKIGLLLEHFEIAPCGEKEVQMALNDKLVSDYEDGLQYYAALNSGCACFVTENLSDFFFTRMETYDSEGFLREFYRPRSNL